MSFVPQTLWVVWSSCIAFLLPTALILLSWAVMAHHFITQGNNRNNRQGLRREKFLYLQEGGFENKGGLVSAG